MQHSSSQQLQTQIQHFSSQQWVRCNITSSMVSKIKNPIWKKELKNLISNPRFQKLKSKKGFDLPATVEQRSMHDQNPGSIPTIKTQEHARLKPTIETQEHARIEAHCRICHSWTEEQLCLSSSARICHNCLKRVGVSEFGEQAEWEWVSFGSESEFWSVLGCVFYLFGIRVTENIEVTEHSRLESQVSKVSNHWWAKCNYPLFSILGFHLTYSL